jgi:putative hydrolase of the HAD superfamily
VAGPFEAIVFDLGGVIVAHDNRVLIERLASRCPGAVTTEHVRALLRRQSWETGAPISDLHGQLAGELGYGRAWDGFVEDWCCHLALDPSMLAFVQRLAGEYRVMLFSNTNQEHWEHLVAASGGALASFEAYLSHELGRAKPAQEAFALVAERAGIEPGRSIFFDDVPANVEGARRAGFQAEVFESQAQLAALLRARGVRVPSPLAGEGGGRMPAG